MFGIEPWPHPQASAIPQSDFNARIVGRARGKMLSPFVRYGLARKSAFATSVHAFFERLFMLQHCNRAQLFFKMGFA
jgi:hypothetical protein